MLEPSAGTGMPAVVAQCVLGSRADGHLHLKGSAGVRAGLLDAVFCGGWTNSDAVIERLNNGNEKYADVIILVHGGGPGIERVVAQWANRNGVHQAVCSKPGWAHPRSRGTVPALRRVAEPAAEGVIAFLGSGITDNSVDKAVALGSPVQRVRPEPSSPSRVVSLRRRGPRFLLPPPSAPPSSSPRLCPTRFGRQPQGKTKRVQLRLPATAKRDLLARFPLDLTSDILDVEIARTHWHLSALPGKYNACGSLEGLASENAPRKRTKPIDRAYCNIWLILHAARTHAGQPCENVGRSNGRTS